MKYLKNHEGIYIFADNDTHGNNLICKITTIVRFSGCTSFYPKNNFECNFVRKCARTGQKMCK